MDLVRVQIVAQLNLMKQPLYLASDWDGSGYYFQAIGNVRVQYKQNANSIWTIRRQASRGPTNGPSDPYVHIVHERTGGALAWTGANGFQMKIIPYYFTKSPSGESLCGDNSGDEKFDIMLENHGGNVFAVKNRPDNQVLDVSGDRTDDGAPVIQFSWNGGDNQRWVFQTGYPPASR